MTKRKSVRREAKSISKENCEFGGDDSIDIIEELTNFLLYLRNGDDCQMLLKPSPTELQNELKFKPRAEKILKHHQQHDLILIEEENVNELQQSVKELNDDLNIITDNTVGEKLEPSNIAEIFEKMLDLKLNNIRHSKNVKPLEDFIKLNKKNLKDMTKIDEEIKIMLNNLLSKTKSLKKSDNKVTHNKNTSRSQRSALSLSNASRRNDQNTNIRVYPRNHVGRIRRLGNVTNANVITESQTHTSELFRLRLESDQSRIMENVINQSNTDQNTRRQNNDLISHDLVMSSIDDLVEYSSLNSAMTLSKDIDDTNYSGDVHLLLQPLY